MANKSKDQLSRPEIKFWLAIIGLAVSGAVCFTNLQNSVAALNIRATDHDEKYVGVTGVLQEVRDSQLRMEKDVEFIYKELGGDRGHE